MEKKNLLLWSALIGLAVFAFSGSALANVASKVINVYGNYVEAGQPESDDLAGVVFENETFKDDVDIEGSLDVTGNLGVTGILTTQDVSLGSKYATSLTFTAGATTTPGGLFAIENTGADKICSRVELDITTGSTVGGFAGTGNPIVFSIATSSAEGVGNGTNLIATTTLATTTVNLLDTVVHKGSGVAVAGQSFQWLAGDVIQGQFDGLSTSPATSSIPYVGMAGNVYITCHDK